MIPEDAVEAAARAHQEMRARLGYPVWDELNGMGQEWRLEHMRAALEAAAPHLMAQAWDEAVNVLYLGGTIGSEEMKAMSSGNPYKAIK